jgi:hypothetical protein
MVINYTKIIHSRALKKYAQIRNFGMQICVPSGNPGADNYTDTRAFLWHNRYKYSVIGAAAKYDFFSEQVLKWDRTHLLKSDRPVQGWRQHLKLEDSFTSKSKHGRGM